jgi:hypothetical protein
MNARVDGMVGRAALVLAAVIVGIFVVLLGAIRFPSLQALVLGPPYVPYSHEELFDVANDIYRESPFTMMIFADNSCGACRAAQPELSRLVEMARTSRVRTVASPAKATDEKAQLAYARSLGVESKDVVRIRPLPRKLRTVPSLVIVNRKGTVLHFQEGVRNTEEIGRLLLSLRNGA